MALTSLTGAWGQSKLACVPFPPPSPLLGQRLVLRPQNKKRNMSTEDFTLYFKSHFKGKGWSKHRAEGVDELVFLFNYNLKSFQHIYENNALIDMEVRGSSRTTHPPNITPSPVSPCQATVPTEREGARGGAGERQRGAESFRGERLRRRRGRAAGLRPAGGVTASRQHPAKTARGDLLSKRYFFYRVGLDYTTEETEFKVTCTVTERILVCCSTVFVQHGGIGALHILICCFVIARFLTSTRPCQPSTQRITFFFNYYFYYFITLVFLDSTHFLKWLSKAHL